MRLLISVWHSTRGRLSRRMSLVARILGPAGRFEQGKWLSSSGYVAFKTIESRSADGQLLSPILPSECATIRCTGLSYKDHAVSKGCSPNEIKPDRQDELGMPYPKAPVLFFKPNTCLNNPGAPVSVPKTAQNEDLDYEVELAVVIGKDCKDVPQDKALEHVLGWTCANDLTSRHHQNQTSQWGYAKGTPALQSPSQPAVFEAELTARL